MSKMSRLKSIIICRNLKASKSFLYPTPIEILTSATAVSSPHSSACNLTAVNSTTNTPTKTTAPSPTSTATNSTNSATIVTSICPAYLAPVPLPIQQAQQVVGEIIKSIDSFQLPGHVFKDEKYRKETADNRNPFDRLEQASEVVRYMFAIWEYQLNKEQIEPFRPSTPRIFPMYRYALKLINNGLQKAISISKSTDNSEYLVLQELYKAINCTQYPELGLNIYENENIKLILQAVLNRAAGDQRSPLELIDFAVAEKDISQSFWRLSKRSSYKSFNSGGSTVQEA